MSASTPVTFWFDLVCPYAYMASERIEEAAARMGRPLCWEPVLLGGLLRALGRPDVPMEAMPSNKRDRNDDDLRRRARWLGVPLVRPSGHPMRTVDAMRCLVATPASERGELAHRLFRAAWQEGHDLGDRTTLQRLVGDSLDVSAVAQDAAVRDGLRDATARAVSQGLFGVPSFGLEQPDEWGVDRLERFVVRHGGQGPASPCAGSFTGTPHDVVEVFHDVASPYSYLGAMQVAAVAAATGAQVQWTPILLGGLFRTIGTPIVPIATLPPTRQAWLRVDMDRAAHAAGVGFRFPVGFPLRTVLPQRVQIVEPAATAPVYRAAWQDGRDVGEPSVLGEVLDQAGLDGASLLAQAAEPAVKQALIDHTARAVGLGVCGVPTFRVGPALFWGQDRLDQVSAALRGWCPDRDPADHLRF